MLKRRTSKRPRENASTRRVRKLAQKHSAALGSRPAAKFAAAAAKTKNSSSSSGDFALMTKYAGRASEFLKALSHEVRLLILCLLCEGERSVTEIEELLSLRQSSVSQHLARLRRDGLVQTKRNGKAIHYSLANSAVRPMIGTLHDVFCTGSFCKGSKRRAD